ncbi:hypothetical protein LUZ60_001398 [Juncus effusus]|nr:hypothetical protein LUZ60_001398 [Juncus effusus]
MAALTRLRHLLCHRHFSSSAAAAISPSAILNPSDPSTPLTSKQKSRAALSLLKLKTTTDPDQIVSICHAAALSSATHLDRAAFSIAVTKLASSNSVSPLRSLISSLLLPSSPPHAIVLFGQAGLIEDSISIFKSHASTQTLNSLLFACLISNKHSELQRIYSEFPKSYGIEPDLKTYNTVIKSFCESGTSRSFYSLLDEMVKKGIKPNKTTFTTALAGFYEEQKFDEINKVLELMKTHNCGHGITAYNTRVKSLCKLKRANEAKDLFKEMESKGTKPNWVTYNHLIYGFCREENLEEAKKLYDEMKKKELVGDSRFYFTVIYFLIKGGEFERAFEVYKEVETRNWIPGFSIMKKLVEGLKSIGKSEEAKEIVEKMKEKFEGKNEMWSEVEESLAA